MHTLKHTHTHNHTGQRQLAHVLRQRDRHAARTLVVRKEQEFRSEIGSNCQHGVVKDDACARSEGQRVRAFSYVCVSALFPLCVCVGVRGMCEDACMHA